MERLFYEMRRAEAATAAFDNAANEALGVNGTDARCLDIVQNEGGSLTAGRLAELSGLTTAAVTAVIDRLERAGYAKRVRDEYDRRRVNVELTPKLLERAEAIWGPMAELGRAELGKLSMDELRLLEQYFHLQREGNLEHLQRVRGIRFTD
jgi:DNA-binding MarR family transcriptional regulator